MVGRDLRHLRSQGMLLLGAIGLACMSPTDGCSCPPTPAVGVLFGRVTGSTGEPVPNAMVSAYIDRDGHCEAEESPDGVDQTQTDGTYTVGVASATELDAACVLVRIRAPIASALENPPDTAVTLRFRYAAPFDSAEVNAQLGAR
jgi:hypothetical protein